MMIPSPAFHHHIISVERLMDCGMLLYTRVTKIAVVSYEAGIEILFLQAHIGNHNVSMPFMRIITCRSYSLYLV